MGKQKQNISKAHHYVPQCYLSRFNADSEDRVWVFDKEGNAPRLQSPRRTGFENGLYLLTDENGFATDKLEKELFSPLDGRIAPVLKRFADADCEPSASDWEALLEFLAVMHMRVPRQISVLAEIGVSAMKHCWNQVVSKPAVYEEMVQKFLDKNPGYPVPDLTEARRMFEDYKIDVDPSFTLSRAITSFDYIYPALREFRGTILNATRGDRFITCDAPLVVFTPLPDGEASFGGGLGLATTEIHFPISPKRCLFMLRRNRPLADLLGPNPVAELNRRTAYMAERFVMSSQNTRTIGELVSEASCTRGLQKLEPGFADAITSDYKDGENNDIPGESADPSDTGPDDAIG